MFADTMQAQQAIYLLKTCLTKFDDTAHYQTHPPISTGMQNFELVGILNIDITLFALKYWI